MLYMNFATYEPPKPVCPHLEIKKTRPPFHIDPYVNKEGKLIFPKNDYLDNNIFYECTKCYEKFAIPRGPPKPIPILKPWDKLF